MSRVGKTLLVILLILVVGSGAMWFWAKKRVENLLESFYHHSKMEISYAEKKFSGFPHSLHINLFKHATKGKNNASPIQTTSDKLHIYSTIFNPKRLKLEGHDEVITFPLPFKNPFTKASRTDIKLKYPQSTSYIHFNNDNSLKMIEGQAEKVELLFGDFSVLNIGEFNVKTTITHSQGNEEHTDVSLSFKDVGLAGFLATFGVKINEVKLHATNKILKDDTSLVHFKTLDQEMTLSIVWGASTLKLSTEAALEAQGDQVSVTLKKLTLQAQDIKKLIQQPPFTLFVKKEDSALIDNALAAIKVGDDSYKFTLPQQLNMTLDMKKMEHLLDKKPTAKKAEGADKQPETTVSASTATSDLDATKAA